MKWFTTFKTWLFSPSVQTWLKNAASVIKQIIGSPEAQQLYIDLISASFGLTAAQIQAIWNILLRLSGHAEAAFPEPGSGDKKYAMVVEEFKKEAETLGFKVPTLVFDTVLHNVLAQETAVKLVSKKK